MIKLSFVNASVRATEYGVYVNGDNLEDILLIALGTKVRANGQGITCRAFLPAYDSPCCNVTITIDPQPVYASIEDDKMIFDSVEEMEEARYEQYQKAKETATKE